MDSQKDQIPPPPGIIDSLLAGFDAAASHVGLVLFPLVLDVWLWLGPHVRIRSLILAALNDVMAMQPVGGENADLYAMMAQVWKDLAERINLFALLRTYPIGVPSLMAGRLPVETPFGAPPMADLNSGLGAVVLWGLLLVLGLLAGALYFLLTARAALPADEQAPLLREWLYAGSQVFILTLLWVLGVAFLFLPLTMLATLMSVSMGVIGQFLLFLAGGAVLWMLIPLLFAAHGIFVHRLFVLRSIRYGVRIVRFTMPSTSLFFLSVFVISRGLDLLWGVPAETSWFTLVGILGHAFIATALLAASFIYYRRAGDWVQQVLDRMQAMRAA